MSRTQRSGWAAITGLAFSVVSMSVGFFTTPVLVKLLGAERFGAYRLLTDWFAYLTLLDFGIVGALIGCMAPSVGRGETDRVKAWMSAGIRSYAWIGSVMIGCGLLLTFVLPSLIKTTEVTWGEIVTAALLLLIPLAMMPLYVFRAVVELHQLIHLSNLMLILQALLTAVLSVGAAYMGYGLAGQALATVIAQTPGPLFLTVKAFQLYPKFWTARLSAEDSKAMWDMNWKSFIFRVTGQISVLSDGIILGWFRGPVAVTGFLITQRLPSILRNQLGALSSSVWPGLLELHSKGLNDTFRDRMLELTRITSNLGLVGLGVIAIYNPWFVQRWVGPQFYSAPVNLLSFVNFWLWAIFGLWHWPIGGAGYIGAWVPYAIGSTILNLTASVVATWLVGPAGPLLGTLVGFVTVYSWAVPKLLRDLFHIRPVDLWLSALRPLRFHAPYLALVWWIAEALRPSTYPALLLHLSLSTGFGLLIWWILELDASSREQWKARFRAVFSRRAALAT